MAFTIEELRFQNGLIPAVIQDVETGSVLMVGYMSPESLKLTLETGYTWFFSRSRGKLWKKGESSGHVQRVREVLTDCDQDTLLIRVEQVGPGACHEGYRSCFHYRVTTEGDPMEGEHVTEEKRFDPSTVYGTSADGVLDEVYRVVVDRKANPQEGSYTTYLFEQGINKILKKVGEEAAEVIIAAKDPDDQALIGEVADLLYHLTVLFAERGIEPQQVLAELRRRRGVRRTEA